MFNLALSETYSWPVDLRVAMDGGKWESRKFDLRFRRLSQSRLDQVFEEADAQALRVDALLREIIVGWSGIVDEAGDALPFSQAALDALLDLPGARRAIADAWRASLREGARGN